MYLNYSLVTEEKKSLSKGIFHLEYEEALNEIYDNEQQEIKEKEQKQITDYYKDAGIDLIEGESFYNALFDDDNAKLLLRLPQSELVTEKFKKAFLEACKEAFSECIQIHEERQKELNEFLEGRGKVQKKARAESMKEIEDFLTYKELVFSDVKTQGVEFPGLTDMKKELYVEYKAKLKNLVDTLMKLEIDVIEQVEEFNRIFKYAISEIINKYIQRIQKLQTILRDYEQQFSEQFEEFCRTCIEHFDKQRLVNVEEDMEIFLISPQKLQSLARECHDRRLTIINKREKITIERLRDWLNDITSRIYSEEIDRNRKRINEIICFKDYYEKEGYSFLFIGDEETDYDDDEKSSSSSVNGN